jgi:urease accessory protein
MNIDKLTTDQVSVLQLSDSFFPTGMYTTSNGLEAIFYSDKSKINDANKLRDLIKVYINHQIGPADCTALGNSYECAQRSDLQKLLEVDQILFSMKLIREIREASTRSGSQLLRCLISFIPDNDLLNKFQNAIKHGQATGVYPVVMALACRTLDISKNTAGIIMLYSFTVSMVGAALRLGMLQHFEGQRIIHELRPEIVETVRKNIERPLISMWQFAPAIDIVQSRHERMNSKMFIT